MSIIFMGTPDFAVSSLQALLDANESVLAVVTAPDKPAGRGRKLNESAVKRFAIANGLPVLQPTNLKNPEFIQTLKTYEADLIVVVAFRMLPKMIWDMPLHGTINLHASLLPQYRGAAPINHAIINGETITGVTTFKLNQEIDTGDVLLQKEVPILSTDDAGDLHDKLMVVGADLLVETVRALRDGRLIAKPQLQDYSKLKPAPKIHKEDCKIEWDNPVIAVHNLIRGLSPYPTAFTEFEGKSLKIFKASYELGTAGEQPGTPVTDGKSFLKFACKDGYIFVHDLQMQDKKRMKVDDLLRGLKLKV